MHSFDLTILLGGIGAFLIFFILQMITFRLSHPEAVLKMIMVSFFATSLIQLLGILVFLNCPGIFVGTMTILTKILLAGLSYLVFGLMAFVYILCVFGPSETSIRIRVIREIFDSSTAGLTSSELLHRYNAQMVLDRRIERLTRSGEIVLKDEKYFLVRESNVFFFIDVIANAIQSFVSKRSL